MPRSKKEVKVSKSRRRDAPKMSHSSVGRTLTNSMQPAASPAHDDYYSDSDQEYRDSNASHAEPVFHYVEDHATYHHRTDDDSSSSGSEDERSPRENDYASEEEVEMAEPTAALAQEPATDVRPSKMFVCLEDAFIASHQAQGATEVCAVAQVRLPTTEADVAMMESLLNDKGDILLRFSSAYVEILHPNPDVVERFKSGSSAPIFITGAMMGEAVNRTVHSIAIDLRGINNTKQYVRAIGPGQQLQKSEILSDTTLDEDVFQFVRTLGISSVDDLRKNVQKIELNGSSGTVTTYVLPEATFDGKRDSVFTALTGLYVNVYHRNPPLNRAGRVEMTAEEYDKVIQRFTEYMSTRSLPTSPGTLAINIRRIPTAYDVGDKSPAHKWISHANKHQIIYVPIKLMCVIPNE